MRNPNNVVSLADWKAKHQRNISRRLSLCRSMFLCVILMAAGGSNWLATLNSTSTFVLIQAALASGSLA